MTIIELKERIEELQLPDTTEIIFYDPAAHEILPIDTVEAAWHDPGQDKLVEGGDPYGNQCLVLYI